MARRIKREKSQKRYAEELKRKIAKSYLSGEASYAVLAEENGLKNKGVVREFVKWYRKKLSEESPNSTMMPSEKKNSSVPVPESTALKEKIKQLEKQLALSNLKVEALEP